MTNEENGIIDWDDMTEQDRINVTDLLRQLNELFDKYTNKDDIECEDSTSVD